MEYYWLILLVTLAALTHYACVGRFEGVLTLDGIFVLSQWVMTTGTLVLLDSSNRADQLYAWVISVPMMLYITVSMIAYWIERGTTRRPFSRDTARKVVLYRPTFTVWVLLFFSALVTIAYFQVLGYNVFALAIRNLLIGTTADYTTLRLNSYSGPRYLYPGYVNQFKNVILPSLTLVVALFLYKTENRHRRLVVIPLALLSVFGIMGTGQRGAFVQFILTVITFTYLYDRTRFARRAGVTGLIAAPLLFLSTFILGRSEDALQQQSGFFTKALTIGQELLKRIFYDNQFTGQMGFRYTYGQPPQDGKEWMSAAQGILPGQAGSSLPNQIFKSLYGSERGTAPPSMWGSAFYNFGWWGLLLLPLVLAVIFQVVTFRSTNRPVTNTLELVGMSGTFVILGNWIAGSPDYLLNAGGLTFAVLWWLGRRASRAVAIQHEGMGRLALTRAETRSIRQ